MKICYDQDHNHFCNYIKQEWKLYSDTNQLISQILYQILIIMVEKQKLILEDDFIKELGQVVTHLLSYYSTLLIE